MHPPEPFAVGKRLFLIISLLFLLTLLAHGNAITSPFNYDDEAVINGEIALTGYQFYDFYPPKYRHLFYLSLAVNHDWGKLNPLGYHLLNIAVHFLTLVTVLLITFFTLDRGTAVGKNAAASISCLTAFLFALHPIQTETVTYISGRTSGLAAFFYLSSLLFFILGSLKKSHSWWVSPLWYLLSWMTFIAAVLSKEIALTLPAILLLYDLIFMRGDLWKPIKNRIFFFYFPLLAGTVFVLILSPDLFSKVAVWLPKLDIHYAVAQVTVLAYAVKLLFLPINLTFDYDFNERFFANGPSLVIAVLIFLSFIYISLKTIPKASRVFYFSIGWFLITVAPTNSFLPRPDLLSERNLYLPSFGLVLLGAVLIFSVFETARNRSRFLRNSVLACLGILFCLLSALLIERNFTYRSNILLWEDTVKKAPGKLRALHNLSHFYLAEKNYSKAFVTLKKLAASRASPFYRSIAHNNLGNIYTHLGKPAQAENEFMEAIRTDPTIPTGYFNLASLHAAQGNFRQAKLEYEQAEERYRLYRWGYEKPAELALNKAKVNSTLGLYQEAEKDISLYLQQAPHSMEGRMLLGKIYAATGREDLAIATYQSVQGNEKARAHNELGVLYIQSNQPEAAILEFKKSVSLNPDFPDAHYNLALLLEKKGGHDKARIHLKTALILNRDPARTDSIRKRLLAMEK